MNTRPNFLYLMTDQQKYSTLGVEIGKEKVSPFYDWGAKQGICFNQAFSPSPICTPSRTSVMTGVHPLVHGVTCHQNRAPFNLKQLPEFLSENGYYTAVCGHYERARNLTRGWHEQICVNEPGELSNAMETIHSYGRKDVGWSSGQMDIDSTESHASRLTNKAIYMLEQVQASKRPYFLHVPYIEPHPPYFAPKPYGQMFDIEKITFDYDQNIAIDVTRPDWQVLAMSQCGTHKAKELDFRKVISQYFGMIRYTNDQMKRLYNEMEARGMLENTWIIISSDHGDFTGEKGLFNKCETLYECLLHVPLIIIPPKKLRSKYCGTQVNDLIDLTDLFSTILSAAKIKIPEYAQGKDLISWIEDGMKRSLHKYVCSQVGDYHGYLKTTFPGGIFECGRHKGLVQAVRSKDYLYINDPDYGEEAYDIKNDPYELKNLFNDPNYNIPNELSNIINYSKLWHKECMRLRRKLELVPGDRGFFNDQFWIKN